MSNGNASQSEYEFRSAKQECHLRLLSNNIAPFHSIVAKRTADLLQGTLDLLILRTLLMGPLHGWGISKQIRSMSEDVLEVNQGSLYPALYRLEDRGMIEAEWGKSDEGRRAKFYQLTAAGRKHFNAEQKSWRLFSSAVEHVLSGA